MKNTRAALSMFMAIAMIFTMSTAVFATGEANVREYYAGSDEDPDDCDIVNSQYEVPDGESYNYDVTHYGHIYDFAAEDYLQSVTVSNTTDFAAEPEGTMTACPENSSYKLFSISIDFLHNPYECTLGAEYETDVTLTLRNGKSVTYSYKFTIDNQPILTPPAFYYNDADMTENLEAGKTYEVRTEMVDRAGLLNGAETRIRLEVEDGEEDYLEVINGIYSAATPLQMKVLRIGTFFPRVVLEKKVAGVWQEVYNMGWEHTAASGSNTDPLPNSDLDNAITHAVDSGDEKIATLPLDDDKVLYAAGLDYLKQQAAANGVTKVTLTPENGDVTLSFDPTQLDTSVLNGKPFTAAVRSTRPENINSVTGITQNKAGSWVDFDFSGELPAPMTVTVTIDPDDFPDGITEDDFRIWYFDERAGRMEQQSIPITYNAQNHTATFTLEHFSAYLLTDSESTPVISVAGGSSKHGRGEDRRRAISEDLGGYLAAIKKFADSYNGLGGNQAVGFPTAGSPEARALIEKAAAAGIKTADVSVNVNGQAVIVTLPHLAIDGGITNYFDPAHIKLLRGLHAVISVSFDGKTYDFSTWSILPEESNRIIYPFEYMANAYHVSVER